MDGFLGGGNRNTMVEPMESWLAGTKSDPGGVIGFFHWRGTGNTLETGTSGSFLGAGDNNSIRTNARQAVVVGGANNLIGTDANWAFLGGGANNSISTNSSYFNPGGGRGNTNGGNYAFLGGALGIPSKRILRSPRWVAALGMSSRDMLSNPC